MGGAFHLKNLRDFENLEIIGGKGTFKGMDLTVKAHCEFVREKKDRKKKKSDDGRKQRRGLIIDP